MTKKLIAFLLVFSMCLSVLPITALAEETVTVTTRSNIYEFKKGDVFTYKFWLRLTPSELLEIKGALQDITEGTQAWMDIVNSMKLEKINGYIAYDKSCLEVVGGSAKMPMFSYATTGLQDDLLAGTLADTTLFDISRDAVYFRADVMTSTQSKMFFTDTLVLFQVSFRVRGQSDEDITIHPKLYTAKMSMKDFRDPDGKRIEEYWVEFGQAYFPYESYETIDNEARSSVLPSLVQDQGFDVRCIENPLETDNFIRPKDNFYVTMMGASAYVGYYKETKRASNQDVVWFYDVPYGTYYVDCSWVNPKNGQRYATPAMNYGEKVNVPASGKVQALWLFMEKDGFTDIPVYINWENDDGYLPARPEFMTVILYHSIDPNNLDVENATALGTLFIERTETESAFNYVKMTDEDGNKNNLFIEVISSDSSNKYVITTEHFIPEPYDSKPESFTITARYTGFEGDLNLIPRSADGHYWQKVDSLSKVPTPEEDGYYHYVCDICHASKRVPVSFDDYHNWFNWEIETAATCTEPGVAIRYCADDPEVFETRPIPAKGHNWSPYETLVAATCESDEVRTRYCRACDEVEVETVEGSGGHYWPNVVYEWDDDMHCTATRTCKRPDCGATETAHATVTDGVYKEPTCIKEGTYRFTATFEEPWALEQRYDITLDPVGHDPVEVEAVAPTCVDKGYTEGIKCSTCGEIFSGCEEIPATGVHSYEHYLSEPTCTKAGIGTGFCSVCGTFAIGQVVVPALGHEWGPYISNNDATDEADGTKTRICARCNAEDTVIDEGSKLTHNYGEFLNYADPTCTECGKFCAMCMDEGCGKLLIVDDPSRPPLGHDWSLTGTTTPDCENPGFSSYICLRCPETKQDNIVPALGHDVEIDEGYPADCEHDGLSAGSHCRICHKVIVPQTVIPGGHKWCDTQYKWNEDYTACTAKRICSVNTSHVEEVSAVVSPPVTVKAGCESDGSVTITADFSACDWAVNQYNVEAIPATGHKWGTPMYEWSEDNSSCTASVTCLLCTKTVSETVRSNVVSTVTCEENGEKDTYADFTSEWAETQVIKEPLPATGHKWGSAHYEWNEDFTECVAVRTCQNDPEHKDTCSAAITEDVSSVATCEHGGLKTVTASFSAKWAAEQTKTVSSEAKGHDYIIDYNWDGHDSCTAYRKCSRCTLDEASASFKITNSITIEPTCTEPGERTYLAVFKSLWAEPQTLVLPMDPKGHSWDLPKYTWSEDYSECTAVRTCKNDKNHEQVCNGTVEQKVTVEPTKTSTGEMLCTASFDEVWASTQLKKVILPVVTIDISSAAVTLGQSSYVHDGFEKTPSVTVFLKGVSLVKDQDYTVTYTDNVDAGTATVTVTGCGEYSGKVTKTFTITQGSQEIDVSVDSSEIAVGRVAHVTVTGSKTRISYASSDPGVATVDENGLISAKSAGRATITVTAAQTDNYSGASKKIEITVVSYVPSEDEPCVIVSNVSGRPGKTVKVKISIKNNPGIYGMTLKFDYDTNVLAYQSAEHSGLTGTWQTPKNITWASSSTDQTYNGDIITATFLIKDGVKYGKYSIGITADIINEAMEPIPFTGIGGTVSVINHVPGDITGDGNVNTLDFITLMKVVAGAEGLTYVEDALDVTGDGKVDTLDFITLMKYVADPESITIY